MYYLGICKLYKIDSYTKFQLFNHISISKVLYTWKYLAPFYFCPLVGGRIKDLANSKISNIPSLNTTLSGRIQPFASEERQK